MTHPPGRSARGTVAPAMRSMTRLSTLALVSTLAVGCGGGDGDPPIDAMPPDANPLCLEAVNHQDLDWIQTNILTPSCSRFNACHKGRAVMAAELNLEAGMSHGNLVGVPSTVAPEWTLVVPGDPEASYLLVQLGHYGADHPALGRDNNGVPITMPYNSPLLCVEMREAIERWIADGALEAPAE